MNWTFPCAVRQKWAHDPHGLGDNMVFYCQGSYELAGKTYFNLNYESGPVARWCLTLEDLQTKYEYLGPLDQFHAMRWDGHKGKLLHQIAAHFRRELEAQPT
jgi:hypothetical protein